MTLWFSSDHHINHRRCLEIMPFRPWKTIEEMNQGLVDNNNSVVKPDDTVVWLGDVLMGGKKHEAYKTYNNKMNGFKIWVLGNHDRGFEDKDLAIYEEFGIGKVINDNLSLSDLLHSDYLNDTVIVSHFPFLGAHSEEFDNKYEACCPIDDGKSILFHGHTHQQVPMVRSRMISVGVDAWGYKPVSFETLMAQIEAHDRYPNKNL